MGIGVDQREGASASRRGEHTPIQYIDKGEANRAPCCLRTDAYGNPLQVYAGATEKLGQIGHFVRNTDVLYGFIRTRTSDLSGFRYGSNYFRSAPAPINPCSRFKPTPAPV